VRRTASVLATVALALCASPASASPEDIFGFGARSMALGATGAASAEDYEAVYANPALLSTARDRSLTLGLAGAVFDMRTETPGRGSVRLPYEALRGSFIGATLPLPFGGVLRDRVAIGLGFFTPFGLVVRGRILYPEKPQWLLADRAQSVAVQAALGVHVVSGLRVGVGFAALAALTGDVLVASDASGRIGTVVEDTLVASYGPIAGASWDLGKDHRVGATFRGELVGRFEVVINARDLGEIVVPPLHISGIAQYDPAQVALEAARVRGPWRWAAGLTFKHWSAYPGPAEGTVRCPVEAPGCAALVPPDPDYSDTVVPRVGVERALPLATGAEARLRAGYFLEPSPAPEQSGQGNAFDNWRSVVTLGYGLALAEPLPPLDLELFGQMHLLHPRTHDKDPSVPAGNAGAPSTESSGVIVAGGATARVRF
jgi:long-chain fatty acid transport protein